MRSITVFIPCDRCRHRSTTTFMWAGPNDEVRVLEFCNHHANRYEPLLPDDVVRLAIEDRDLAEGVAEHVSC